MDSQLYHQLKKTVVRTACPHQETKADGTVEHLRYSGSGVVFDKRGYVLTCAHVIPNVEFCEISYFTSEKVTVDTGVYKEGEIALLRRDLELAVLKCSVNQDKDDYPFAVLNTTDGIDIGKKLYTINHAASWFYSGLVGFISHQARKFGKKNLPGLEFVDPDVGIFQIQGFDSVGGASGGPVFDERGQIVSVLTARSDLQNFAVDPEVVRGFIKEFYEKLRNEELNELQRVKTANNKRKKREQRKRKKIRSRENNEHNPGVLQATANSVKSSSRLQNYGQCSTYWFRVLIFFPLFVFMALAVYSASEEGGFTYGAVSEVVGWKSSEFGKYFMINSNLSPSFEKKKLLADGIVQKGDQSEKHFVKVYADGVVLGRMIDLNVHACYATLTQTIEDIFGKKTEYVGKASEYLLAYEDSDGDLLLLGDDVPWWIFLKTVKRLRLMRRFEAHGHG